MNLLSVILLSLLLLLLISGIGGVIADETYGDVLVKSDPAGAIVTLDNTANMYQTPYQYYGLKTGRHTLTIKKMGYQIYTNNDVVVSPGMVTNIYAVLIKDPNYGTIRVSSYPAGADVYVDGTLRGKTIVSKGVDYKTDYLFISGLADGIHTVVLKLNGYKVATKTVETGSGKVAAGSVDVTMDPIAPDPDLKSTLTSPAVSSQAPTPVSTPAEGALIIESVPSGAHILMNGTVQGVTPKKIDNLPAGKYVFSLQLIGYTPVTTRVDIMPGQNVNRTINLSQIATPPPTSTQPSTTVPATSPPTSPIPTQASGSPLAIGGSIVGLLIIGIFNLISRR
ncbi:MAG TPA: PEGA domain-containing protein [Methanospirillum sp.]|nr:PEGA domain-containing protein [Methanospirillum sp.]